MTVYVRADAYVCVRAHAYVCVRVSLCLCDLVCMVRIILQIVVVPLTGSKLLVVYDNFNSLIVCNIQCLF